MPAACQHCRHTCWVHSVGQDVGCLKRRPAGYRLLMATGTALTTPAHDCPKRMVFGPCGGVRLDGQCEMREGACAFGEVVRWPGAEPTSRPARVPVVLTDFSCAAFDTRDVAATAAILAMSCDAVLVGEHQNKP